MSYDRDRETLFGEAGNARDEGVTIVRGFRIGLDVTAGDTTIDLDGGILLFENVTAITADQWIM